MIFAKHRTVTCKLKDNRGLSLVEVLCAVLMLVFLSLLMTTGINFALNTQNEVTAESETQLLLNSLSDALNDKLRYCQVTVEPDGTTSLNIGSVSVTGRPMNPEDPPEGIIVVGNKRLLPDGVYAGGKYKAAVVRSLADKTAITLPCKTEPVVPSIADGTATFKFALSVKDTASDIGAETELVVRCLNPVIVKDAAS